MGRRVHEDIEELLGASSSSNQPAPTVRRVSVGAGNESAIAGEAYEGASRTSREMALWSPPLRSADLDIIPEKRTADGRTRDISRNDAYVVGGQNLRKDNIVGSMFMLNAKPSSTVLFGKEDTTWEDEFQEEVETKFTLYAESPECWLDASRKNTLTEMIRLLVGVDTLRGESLWTAEWRREDAERRPFNTAVQIVDLDRLSTPPEEYGNPNIRGGVKLDSFGAPQGYYFQMSHPSDWTQPDAFRWKYVPARKPWGRLQVAHVFEQVREEQTRGIAQMVSALKEMRQTKNFRDIVLQNAVVNATYAATIESDLPTEAIFARLGGQDMDGPAFNNALNAYIGGWMNQIGEYMGGSKNLRIDGVKIPHLPPGSKLQLKGAGEGGPLGTDFESSLLRYIAASLDVSYEQLSRDYTKTNYSSARAAMNETNKAMVSRKKAVADRHATFMYRLWLEEALNAGSITSIKRNMPSYYDGQNTEAYSRCDWIGASRGQIDELKETQAAVLRVNNGLSTIEQECARLGLDWRTLMRQLAREKEWKEFYKILENPTDTKNQMNAASGTASEASNGDQ